MADADAFQERPEIQHFIERVTEAPENAGVAAEIRAETITPAMVSNLNRKVKGVLRKIEILQDQIKRTAKESIPVKERAYEVRHALRTLYPDRGEDNIFIDQFINAVQYGFDRNKLPLDLVVSELSGNTELDARLLESLESFTGDGLDFEELATFAGQYMLVYIANRLLKPFTAPDSANVAAPKIYPGTERAPMAIQMIIGMAALLLQIVENREAVKGLVERTLANIPGVDPDDILAQAEQQPPDDLITDWYKTQRPYFHDVIYRYCLDYITETTDPGYEGWTSYDTVEGYKADAQQMEGEFDSYGRTEEEINLSQFVMTKDTYRLMTLKAMDTNEQLNKVFAVLNSRVTAELLCCLVIFIGTIPTRQVRLLRAGVCLFAKGITIDLNAEVQAVSARANQFLAENILEPVMHEIDRFFQQNAEEALQLLDRSQWEDPELYDVLMACTPVDDMIEYALHGLDKAKQKLKELFMRAWERLRVKSIKGNFAWRIMADSRRAKIMLSLIDRVIELVERGNLCAREGGTTPSVEEIEEATNSLSRGQPPLLQVPVGGDPYETFDTKPFNSSLGLPVQSTDVRDGVRRFRVEDCLRRTASPQEILKAIGLSAQLDRDMRDASNIDRSRTNP